MGGRNLFKKEFEQKLLYLKIKTVFIKAIKNDLKELNERYTFNERVKMANKKKDWVSFIAAAFVWEYTKDGHKYWHKIARMNDSDFGQPTNVKLNGKETGSKETIG